MADAVTMGRHIEDVVQGEIGCLYSIAAGLSELRSALYWTWEEFRYDENNPIALDLAARAQALMDHIEKLSLAADGTLTDNRECRRCSGDGKTAGEDPCIECGGQGYVNAEEADG